MHRQADSSPMILSKSAFLVFIGVQPSVLFLQVFVENR